MPDAWRPTLGTWLEGDAVHTRVWAPTRRKVEVVLERPGAPVRVPLEPRDDGHFAGVLPGARAGDRYRVAPDDAGPFPDPASRFQPDGVHGSSEIIDPRAFRWTDHAWSPPSAADLVVYELHVGTFSPAGTFDGVRGRLPWLAELGITAIELMPVADFPGRWNWGYDGVSLFAPARAYGRPDDLRAVVDAAHAHGIAVLLDVVYNHLGPDGAYLAAVSPRVFTKRHRTPWGDAINFDGDGSAALRSYFIANALHWIREYHIDGLRLDATHAIVDDSPRHFLAEFAERVRAGAGRPVMLVAEDHRNLDTIVRAPETGGWGFDGTWSDDFHHEVRRHLTGDGDGYFVDFTGRAEDLATTIRRGWFFSGQFAEYFGEPRGTDPTGLPPRAFTIFTQNHDQVGNRAYGERLHHDVDDATWRAVSVLLLAAPETPLLFMGQEWAASTPFRYFTDHNEELGRLVTEGRRREFSRFRAFSSPEARNRIPDPQAPATFESSRLKWEETKQGKPAATLRLYRALLALRRSDPLLHRADWRGFAARALDEDTLWLERRLDDQALLVVVRTRGSGDVVLNDEDSESRKSDWKVVLTTEDPEFTLDPHPIKLQVGNGRGSVRFERPGAVILRAVRESGSG
ncbi:MAG TPA: malto-oligosyltrehalose trehalohydrolase [Gemmatimonadaceae bacterium]|nr:malto-oligosyltrehalose trehalohydrolase [Gemmatimonadaceae bacterium]